MIKLNIIASLICFSLLFLVVPTNSQQLKAGFYDISCPNFESIVYNTMQQAVQGETRMAASILRLFFHDCFVQGCDASVLLDDTATFRGEKTAVPNANSLRGFDVIDTIKANVESACKGIVSCADILAVAARDAVILSGGPNWSVLLGRRDARTASFDGANANLPAATLDVTNLTDKFRAQGLSVQDLVTLSGAHTIGQARCTFFRKRLYNMTGNGQPDSNMSKYYLLALRDQCPSVGGDDNLSLLDSYSVTSFDNHYYVNLKNQRGLLNSDQVLYSTVGSSTIAFVQQYSQNPRSFFDNFVASMVKLGNINPLTDTSGEVRQNCRVPN